MYVRWYPPGLSVPSCRCMAVTALFNAVSVGLGHSGLSANNSPWLLEFYIRATSKVIPGFLLVVLAKVFQLYHGGDMMNLMRRRKPETTPFSDSRDLLPLTPYRHGMRGTGL